MLINNLIFKRVCVCGGGYFKGTVHQKFKVAEKCLTLRLSKMLMSLFLHQIWRNVTFHHLFSNGCSAVNGCRQNESPNS